MESVELSSLAIGKGSPIALMAGPCQIESLDHCLMVAERILEALQGTNFTFIFKSSFDKANRTSVDGIRGVGLDRGLEILAEVSAALNVPVMTDVHLPDQCARAAEVCELIQIPAFLCRQTDLLIAAGESGAAVQIKRGQFVAPWKAVFSAEKVASTGNERIVLCERGTSFGHSDLVNDFRSLPIMRSTGYPVSFDATHSVQQPGGSGSATGGQRQFIQPLARAAAAVGIDALFIETHEDPDRAPSDGASMLPLDELRGLLVVVDRICSAMGEELDGE